VTVFVDTSALYALLDPDDAEHGAAASYLAGLEDAATELVTHDYVLVETTALLQSRLGMPSVRRLHDRVLPAVTVRSVPPAVRETAVAALLAADVRRVSLVDRVSFELMRRWELEAAFAFDDDFDRQGFACVP
jgi:predicted nucleic acid-binding protein